MLDECIPYSRDTAAETSIRYVKTAAGSSGVNKGRMVKGVGPTLPISIVPTVSAPTAAYTPPSSWASPGSGILRGSRNSESRIQFQRAATKRLVMHTAPRVLLLHLKQEAVHTGMEERKGQAAGSNVSFGITLDLEVDADLSQASPFQPQFQAAPNLQATSGVRYKLLAVVERCEEEMQAYGPDGSTIRAGGDDVGSGGCAGIDSCGSATKQGGFLYATYVRRPCTASPDAGAPDHAGADSASLSSTATPAVNQAHFGHAVTSSASVSVTSLAAFQENCDRQASRLAVEGVGSRCQEEDASTTACVKLPCEAHVADVVSEHGPRVVPGVESHQWVRLCGNSVKVILEQRVIRLHHACLLMYVMV